METSDAAGVTGIIWRRVDPARELEAETLMRQLMLLSRQHQGFLGSEIFPPIPGVQDAYVVLYRFSSSEHLRDWLHCDQRLHLIRQMDTLLLQPAHEFFVAHRGRAPGTASTVFAYRIREGREAHFAQWRTRILEACRQWPGFLGAEAFDTLDSHQHPEFVVVVRFDSREHLDAWTHSDIRRAFIEEVRPLVHDYRVRRQGTGFEGWFDISDQNHPPAPWRQGLVVLTALFPVIMTLRALLTPIFKALPLPVAFLILLTIDLAVLTFVVMPRFSRMMGFWLRPKPEAGWQKEAAGWMIILGIIGATLGISLLLS